MLIVTFVALRVREVWNAFLAAACPDIPQCFEVHHTKPQHIFPRRRRLPRHIFAEVVTVEAPL